MSLDIDPITKMSVHNPDCNPTQGIGWGRFPCSLDELCPSKSYFVAWKSE